MLIINKNGIVGKAVEDLRRASFTTPDGETILLRDLLELCELIKSRGGDCNYQVIENDGGFVLFPMNGDGEVLRYPEEPEKKDFNLDIIKIDRDGYIGIGGDVYIDSQPWIVQPTTAPWIAQVDNGTTGNINDDTLTWKITWKTDGSGLLTGAFGGIDNAAT